VCGVQSGVLAGGCWGGVTGCSCEARGSGCRGIVVVVMIITIITIITITITIIVQFKSENDDDCFHLSMFVFKPNISRKQVQTTIVFTYPTARKTPYAFLCKPKPTLSH
jgi:hypothetical protein